MGYYADLIKEKKEKQNKVVKRGTFKSGNWWISQETAWPNRIVYSAHAEYTSGPYKGEHHGTDSLDSLEKAESYVKRLNSKEEKDNDKVVEKYTKYGVLIEIIETDGGHYRYAVSRNGKGHETLTVQTSISAAKREAEYAAKNLENEKEEGYYAKLAEEKVAKKNANNPNGDPKNIAVSLLADGYSVDKAKREMKSIYGYTDKEIFESMAYAIGIQAINKYKK